MAVELLTGHKGTVDHITAKNGRWMNRATYGSGNYMLVGKNGRTGQYDNDYAYCSAGYSNSKYTPTLYEGIILWNGMFIYVTGNTTHSEGIDSCLGWKVYLHYTKASNIESVEVVFTNDDSSFASKIKTNAEFTDSLSEAYVLYATYTNASGTGVTYAFEKKKASTALIQALSDSLDTTNTAVAGKLDTTDYTADQATRETTINNNIAKKVSLKPFAVSTVGTDYDRILLGTATCSRSLIQTDSASTEVTLSESAENFAYIEIRRGTTTTEAEKPYNSLGIFPVAMLKGTSTSTGSALGDAHNLKLHKEWVKTYSSGSPELWQMFTACYVNGAKAYIWQPKEYANGNFQTSSQQYYWKFYGIGRVAS